MENKCNQPAIYRYTWVGRDESFVCVMHAMKINGIADAMGYQIQFIPLTMSELIEEKMCQQNEREV